MTQPIPLIVDRRGSVLNLALNNPERKNALNSEMMGALIAAIEESKNYDELRVIIIQGKGDAFCSGADLNSWKPSELQELLKAISQCPIPTVADVHGVCLGGGMGLISACDFIVAKQETTFGFPEIQIGLIPAVIFPYVSSKLHHSKIRELFITGERFGNKRATELGLLYHNEDIQSLISLIKKGAPSAQKHVKALLNSNVLSKSIEERDLELANLISKIKEDEECKEGINSFLEKRNPNWVEE